MNTIKDLLRIATGKKAVPANFEIEKDQVEEALRDELRKLAGTYNLFRRNMLDIFEILQESFDEVLPNRVVEALGMFAEVKTYGQSQKPIFTTRANKQRGKQFVTRVALSGVYETFRLDKSEFEVPTAAYGGAAIIDFERYLDGHESLMELYDIIQEGLLERVYDLVQEALLASFNDAGRPANTKFTGNTFDPAEMDTILHTVGAYGSPIILTSPQFAAQMFNYIGANYNPNIAAQDLTDIRERGYVGKFHGIPIVVLPQSFTDETNSKFVIRPDVAFILPAGKERLVKVAFEGNTIVDEWKNRDRSMEIQVYKKMGVALVGSPHYWGIYQNTSVEATGWDSL